ncbi:MAG: DNA gyrase inhibitor YacG [Acinetobacter sp.]|nr:MAG: DNA gyrase inhibitor YacG [Acinetobacter sp.]
MTTPAAKTFPCPRCGQPSTWTNNAFRPFCCERCKLIDLGAWANEDYRIATQESNAQTTPEYDQD